MQDNVPSTAGMPAASEPARQLGANRFQTVASLAGVIGHPGFPAGDRAALRRMRPGETWPPAFWRILMDRVPEVERRSDEAERTWASIMQSMAIMAPHVHAPGARLGAVLASVGGNPMEHRLLQLLRLSGSRLEDAVRLLARRLAGLDQPVDWRDMASLLLLDPATDPGESARRRIARDFYAWRRHQSNTQD